MCGLGTVFIWSKNSHRSGCLPSAFCRLVTGEIMDEDVSDPLANMFTYLQEKRDKALAQEWGVWLVKWDSERALKVSLVKKNLSPSLSKFEFRVY